MTLSEILIAGGAALLGVVGIVFGSLGAARAKRAEERADSLQKHNQKITKTAGDMLKEKAREDADAILKTLPLDPSDEEADRLLREAERRLKNA